jgi:hypothetical protein
MERRLNSVKNLIYRISSIWINEEVVMKGEVKESLKRNSGIIFLGVVIILLPLVVDVSITDEYGTESMDFVLVLLGFFILADVFRQALAYESEEMIKKITKILVILALLGVVVFMATVFTR